MTSRLETARGSEQVGSQTVMNACLVGRELLVTAALAVPAALFPRDSMQETRVAKGGGCKPLKGSDRISFDLACLPDLPELRGVSARYTPLGRPSKKASHESYNVGSFFRIFRLKRSGNFRPIVRCSEILRRESRTIPGTYLAPQKHYGCSATHGPAQQEN
jgi:hypothetical protein